MIVAVSNAGKLRFVATGMRVGRRGQTHDVLATSGLAPDQRLLSIPSPHLLKAYGAVAFDFFAIPVLF